MELTPVHIAQARGGDATGQQAVYAFLAPMVLGICRRYMKSSAEAEDVMITTMYNVLSRLEQFRDGTSIKAWASKIAVNQCLMELRKRKLEWSELQNAAHPSARTLDAQHQLEHLKSLIQSLPSGYRLVFNLVEVDGYTHREVAAELGISESASRSQLSRAKSWLQKQIEL